MAPLASTRSTGRRVVKPGSPRAAVVLMALASALLLAVVLIALPRPAEGTSAPILSVEEGPVEPTSLLSAPSRVALPTPRGDEAPSARVIVNHRQPGVSLDAQLANGDGLTLDLTEAGPRATAITVTSDRVHMCGRYAGSLILEATHDTLPSDLAVLEVQHAECGETAAVTMAPSSVNDTSQTWGDEGRAPWKSRPAPPPPPEGPQPPPPPPSPEPEPEAEEQDETEEAAPEPEPEPEPTATSEPTSEPEPTPEPEPTTTSEPDPEPTATSEPEPEPTATTEPTSEPTTGDGGSSTTTASAEPTATETSTEG